MNVLLLTPLPPCPQYTGCILLEAMCRFLPADAITCFCPIDEIPDNITIAPDLQDMHVACAGPTTNFSRVRRQRFAKKLPGVDGLAALADRAIGWRAVVDAAVKIGTERGVDRIWCILQEPVLCKLGLEVAQRLGVPLYTQIWDYPDYWARMNNFGRTARQSLLNDFQKAVRSSSCCAAASREMAYDITEVHGCPAVPIVGSLDRYITNHRVEHQDFARDEVTIGMAGQLYASGAWSALLRALESVDWKIAGKQVRLRYLGYNRFIPDEFIIGRSRNACIEYLGYRPLEGVVSVLSSCDINYAPFFSGEVLETLTHTSFPAKVASYLAAGRPVFFHGPTYAPASKFLEENSAGVTCGTLDPAVIVEGLTGMVEDEPTYRRLKFNARRAFTDHLTLDSLRENFTDFITAPPRDVRGIA